MVHLDPRIEISHDTLFLESSFKRFDIPGPGDTRLYPTADGFVEAFGQGITSLALAQGIGDRIKAMLLSLVVRIIPFCESLILRLQQGHHQTP